MTGLPALLLDAAAAFAQGAAGAGAASELPAIEVTVSPQTKYPPAKAKRKATASGSTPPPQQEAPAEAAPAQGGVADALPSIATAGSILNEGYGEGSGQTISAGQLYTSHVFTANEALRTVPGVSVRDEEGFGMRPNIGIRGMNPTRSTKTLLLEDGLFLTFAPYGDNASYFHPLMDRFASVEVIKGADQLLYGPHTISGTINYLTPNPPKTPGGFAAITGGTNDYLNGQIYYGGWWGPVGAQIDYVRKQGQGARDNTEHAVDDVGFKGIWQLNERNAVILKASAFREDSQVTYTGITDAEAQRFGIRYNPFKNDEFDTERFALSATHNFDVTSMLSVASSVYWNSFDREWWRQASTTTDTQCGFVAARGAGLAIDPDTCNSRQGRLRYYDTYGFDQRYTFDAALADDIRTTLKAGYRLHREDQARLQVNATSPTGTTGTLAENNDRGVFAYSFFMQNKFEVGAFSITPAFRYETIETTRVNNLTGVGGCAQAPCEGNATFAEFIPGVSVGYEASKQLSFFAGVHEGFAPPRVEDAIANSGGSVDINPEKSTNIEAGFRSQPLSGVKIEGTWFRNDFSNLAAVGSIAGGSTGYAEGEALFEGTELFARVESGPLAGTSWSLYSQVAWTYLWDAVQSSPFTQVGNNTIVAGSAAGNRQPYAPEHLVTGRIGYAERTFDAYIEMVFVGEQFSDFANSTAPMGTSGQFAKLDAYTVFNLGMTYTYEPSGTDVFFSVKNLFDEAYIVDRTRGILPGSERLIQVGVKQKF